VPRTGLEAAAVAGYSVFEAGQAGRDVFTAVTVYHDCSMLAGGAGNFQVASVVMPSMAASWSRTAAGSEPGRSAMTMRTSVSTEA
jgi:hypothetical protein